ncbi:MAG: response regulator [Gemmatimonadota bacterium]
MKGQTILVVEDDDETLNVLSRTLAAGGFEVVWARDGSDALKVLTKHDHVLSLMIVDVVLPGMSGPELVQELHRTHPGAGAIYVSAHDADTVRSHGVDPDTMPFMSKPYEPSDLLRLVNESLPRA